MSNNSRRDFLLKTGYGLGGLTLSGLLPGGGMLLRRYWPPTLSTRCHPNSRISLPRSNRSSGYIKPAHPVRWTFMITNQN